MEENILYKKDKYAFYFICSFYFYVSLLERTDKFRDYGSRKFFFSFSLYRSSYIHKFTRKCFFFPFSHNSLRVSLKRYQKYISWKKHLYEATY